MKIDHKVNNKPPQRKLLLLHEIQFNSYTASILLIFLSYYYPLFESIHNVQLPFESHTIDSGMIT